ncbi:hypothetical protein KA013_03325 [Patescibacteria group bacterium]|nr:hypothetical protein [Patescibacteria group bacterium]
MKWMIEQIRDNDKKQIEENALKMIEILTQGEYNQTHIEEIKVKVYKDLEENGRIKLPTDVIVLQNPVNEYKYIQSLDELVSTLNISPEQLKEFEHIKDQVHVKEKSLLELHSYVATLTEMKEETLDYNEVKENIEPLLDQMHLTEAQKTNYADMLRVYSPTR